MSTVIPCSPEKESPETKKAKRETMDGSLHEDFTDILTSGEFTGFLRYQIACAKALMGLELPAGVDISIDRTTAFWTGDLNRPPMSPTTQRRNHDEGVAQHKGSPPPDYVWARITLKKMGIPFKFKDDEDKDHGFPIEGNPPSEHDSVSAKPMTKWTGNL